MKIKNKYVSLLLRSDSKWEENLDFDQENVTQQYGQDSIKISPSKDSCTVASLFSNKDITKRVCEQFNQNPSLRQVKSISTDYQPEFFAIGRSNIVCTNTVCKKLTQKSPLLQKPLISQQITRLQFPSERLNFQLPIERGYSDRTSIYSLLLPNEKGLPGLISSIEPNKPITTKTLNTNRSWKRHRQLKQCSVPQLDKRAWKEDAVLKVLRARLIMNNKNEVQSLRTIFLVQLYGISVQVTHFYIPYYKKILNQFGLEKDWAQWVGTVGEVLRIPEMYFYFLDGSPIESLFGIPNHEEMIYITTQRIFNFWSIIKQNQKMENEFQVSKYSELLTTLHDLKTKEDIIKFFTHRQNLLPFFNKEGTMKIDMIDMDGLRNQDFGRGMLGLDKMTARIITEAIQQLMNLEVPQYKCRINAQQLDSRYRNINNLRKNIKPIVNIPEEQPTTKDLIGRGDQAIHQISNEAFQKVSKILKFPAPKIIPPRKAVSNPFELLNFKSLDRFASILTSVNVDYIMNEKQMSRVDIINYLVVFKCLMDSDSMPFQEKLLFFDGTNMDRFQVSKVHILRSLPYIVLYKNSLNVAELNVQTSGQGYLKFYDFLDIFNES